MRVILYTRVSTDDQASKGQSLDSQIRRLHEFVESKGYTTVSVESDPGKSAKNLKRPGLQNALRMLREGQADGIVVSKLDRLTRSVGDWSKLQRDYWDKGKSIISLSEQIDLSTAAGWFASLMFVGLAEMERRQTSERVTVQSNERKKSGLRYCRSVYGFRVETITDTRGQEDFRMVPCEDEQAIIRQMQGAYEKGKSYGVIAEILNDQGVKPPRGNQWYPMTIKRVLDRQLDSVS